MNINLHEITTSDMEEKSGKICLLILKHKVIALIMPFFLYCKYIHMYIIKLFRKIIF